MTYDELTDPHGLPAADAVAVLADAPWNRLAVLGDSVTAGVMGPLPGYREVPFATRLGEALAASRPGFAWCNLATPYLRTKEIREQQLNPALAFRPDLVLLSAGGNDALSRKYDAGRLTDELDALLSPLAETGALVVTIGLYDLPRSGLLPADAAEVMMRRFDELDRITAHLTRSIGGVHVDTHHHPLAADPGIFAEDRIHANARGHAVAFAAIVEALTSAPVTL